MNLSQIIANGFHKTFTGSDVTITEAKMKACEEFLINGQAVTKRKQEALWGRYIPCDGITNGASTSIDTGIKAQDNMEMFVRFKAITGSFYILQARQTGSATIYGISGAQSYNTINAYGITSSITRTVGHIYTVKMTMVNRAVTLYVKDETAGTEDTKTGTASASDYTFPSQSTIKLFGDASMVASGVTVYRAYIKINGTMAWDMYPCVDVNNSNAPVAYDDVTHTKSTVVSGNITGGSLIQPISYVDLNDKYVAIGHNTNVGSTYKQEVEFMISELDTEKFTSICGADNGLFLGVTTAGKFAPHNLSSGALNIPVLVGVWHRVVDTVDTSKTVDNVTGTFDGVEYRDKRSSFNSSPWFIGGLTGVSYGRKVKIRKYRVWKDDELIYDFSSAKVGTNSGFIDLLTGNIYNATGFQYGADIPYTQLCPDILETNCGDVLYGVGKNLFDKNNRTRIYGYFQATGTTWSYATAAYSNKIPCKPNTTYTARYNGTSTQTVLGFGSCSTDEEPSASTQSVTVTQAVRKNSPTIATPITITTGPNDKWLIVAYNVAEPEHTDMADNLQVQEGPTATPYEPYHFGLHPSGEQRVVTESINKFDKNTKAGPVAGGYSEKISTEPGTTYIVKNFNRSDRVDSSPVKGYTSSNVETPIPVEYYPAGSSYSNCEHIKFTIPANCVSFVFGIRPLTVGEQVHWEEVMLVKGITAPAFYEPYSAPQVRTITTFLPSATSFIDAQKASNNVECDWKIMAFTGAASENWMKNSDGVFYIVDEMFQKKNKQNGVLCDRYEYVKTSVTSAIINGKFSIFCTGAEGTAAKIVVHDDRFTTVAKWKAHLASEPAIVAFPRETPEVTTVAINPVTLANGTNRVTASSGTVKVTANVRVI